MDQALLVGAGQTIVRELDSSGRPPRAALWVHNEDTDVWKLWLVPESSQADQRTFYRQLAEIVSRNRATLGEIDAADAELVSDRHPAITGLGALLRLPGLGSARYTNNQFDGFFLPDGIILRMNV